YEQLGGQHMTERVGADIADAAVAGAQARVERVALLGSRAVLIVAKAQERSAVALNLDDKALLQRIEAQQIALGAPHSAAIVLNRQLRLRQLRDRRIGRQRRDERRRRQSGIEVAREGERRDGQCREEERRR